MKLEISTIQIVIAVTISIFTIIGMFIFRKREKIKQLQAKEDYYNSITAFSENPEDTALKHKCYQTGEIYFRYILPDTYASSLPGHGPFFQGLDNSTRRKELIENDIKECLRAQDKYKEVA